MTPPTRGDASEEAITVDRQRIHICRDPRMAPELLSGRDEQLNMLRIMMVSLLALGLAAQQPPDESNVPEAEKRIPPGHYCKREGVPIGRTETHAHSCACTFACTVDDEGNVIEQESANCLAYCHVNNRRCTCHVEEPANCDSPRARAWVDMDGRLVAMAVKRRP